MNDFGISGGGSNSVGFTLIDGSGTTANGSAVDLGGTLTQDTTITAGTNFLHIDSVPEVGATGQLCVSQDLFGLGIPGIGFQFKLSADEWYFVKTSNDTTLGGSHTASIGYINLATSSESFLDCTEDEIHLFTSPDGAGYTGVQIIKADKATNILVDDVAKASFGNTLIGFTTDLQFSDYPNTRDDSADVPENFLYTSASGEVQSAPLNYAKSPFFTGASIPAGLAGSATNYVGLITVRAASTESQAQFPVQFALTVSKVVVNTISPQTATGSLVFTIRKNGVDTALTVTIAAGSVAGTYTSTSDIISFAENDNASIKVTNNGTSISPIVSLISCKINPL